MYYEVGKCVRKKGRRVAERKKRKFYRKTEVTPEAKNENAN
jgi:hypothetical protein